GEDAPRAGVLGMLRLERGLDVEAISRLFDGSRFAPEPLTSHERNCLAQANLAGAPPYVAGSYPEWPDGPLARTFGEDRSSEGAALATGAAIDLRVNTLKAEREQAHAALEHLGAERTRWSLFGLRISLSADAKSPAIHAEPAFINGWVEIQDEGSQIAGLLAAAHAEDQATDICAGGGGKALALATSIRN